MRTPTQPLGAIFGTVDGHAAPDNPCSALGFAVDRLRAARSSVLLQSQPSELHIAELADGTAQNAGKGQMIRHHYPRDLRSALVRARNRIVLAGIQMGLKFAQLVGPFAALLVVDAEHQRSHDGLLRFRVRVDNLTDFRNGNVWRR